MSGCNVLTTVVCFLGTMAFLAPAFNLEELKRAGYLPPGTEIPELGNENSRHYSNGDGTITAEIFASPAELGVAPGAETDDEKNCYPDAAIKYSTGICEEGRTDKWDYDGELPVNGGLMYGIFDYYGIVQWKNRAWAKFNTSSIPSTAMIERVVLNGTVYPGYGGRFLYVTTVPNGVDPVSPQITGFQLWNYIGSGTVVAQGTPPSSGLFSWELNQAGKDLVQNGLAYGYSTLGFRNDALYPGGVLYGRVFSQRPYLTVTYTVENPMPVLTGINPASKYVGDQEFLMTLTGSSFIVNSRVRLNGADRPTTYKSATTLEAIIPASDMQVAGVCSIEVFNPGPGGGRSNRQPFTVQNPVPVTTGLSPNEKFAGESGFTLTVGGSHFASDAQVRWNNSVRPTTYVNTSTLQAEIPASDLVTAGIFSVDVVNPAPGGGVSNAQTFTVKNRVPVLTSISPAEKYVGDATFVMTVNGTDFISSSAVRVNGQNRTTAFVNSTMLQATIPASDMSTAGTRSITVYNPGPGGGTSNVCFFTVLNPTPVITALEPETKYTGDPVFLLVVKGNGFVPSSQVKLDGSSRSTTYVSPTELRALIPAADMAVARTYTVTVFNPEPGGGTSAGRVFNVVNRVPTLAGISPENKNLGDPGFTMTVTGSGFLPVSEVRFAGSSRPTTYVSSTVLQAAISASDLLVEGEYPITVYNPPPGGGISGAINFIVSGNPSWPEGWSEVRSMPTMPTPHKSPKDGSWLVVGPDGPVTRRHGSGSGQEKSEAMSVIYAAKGNKTYDFYKYYPLGNSWVTLSPLPDTEPSLGKPRPPARGTCAVSDGERFLYMVKGNNTQGFWRYNIVSGVWDTLFRVPEKIKGGNDLVYVKWGMKEYLYLLAGGKGAFYRYDVEEQKWYRLDSAPYAKKRKYDKGSFLVYDRDKTVYVHQAAIVGDSNHFMFRYDLEGDSWLKAAIRGVPLYGDENGRPGKKKKSKDGAAAVWHNGCMYVLKGGGSQGFYKYDPQGKGTWVVLETIPSTGSGGKKAVKAGGDLVYYGLGAFFALKGNKTYELWRYYKPGVHQFAVRQSGYDGIQTRRKDDHLLSVVPNPIASGFAIVKLSRELVKQSGGHVRVFDATGRCVLSVPVKFLVGQGTTTSVTLSLRELPAGVYLLCLEPPAGQVGQKLVVQH